MPSTLFDLFHPVVAASYFVGILAVTMGVFQPPILAISAAAGIALNSLLRGGRAAIGSLAWQLPFLAIIALLNPFFNSMGTTEILRIGTQAVYLESFAYGICMGIMLLAVIAWASCAAQIITSDKLMALTGKAFPTIGLMLSMCARLVPHLVNRGRRINAMQQACTATRSNTAASALRLSTALMSWSMEDSLETSDAMRARGWGASSERTTYARIRFRTRDAAALIAIIALALADVALVLAAGSEFRFYPTIGGLAPWWAYLPHAALAFLPLLTEAGRLIAWSR